MQKLKQRVNIIKQLLPVQLIITGREVAELHNADIEANKEFKHKPIYLITYSNSAGVAELLLQHNGNIEAKGQYNRTPFPIPASTKSVKIAELLFQHISVTKTRDKFKQLSL